MSLDNQTKPRRAGRVKEERQPAIRARNAVALGADAHTSLSKAAKKLAITNTKYTAAAVAYFVENGLDPTADRSHGGAQIERRVAEETRVVRVHTADVGNRLVVIIRTWEKPCGRGLSGHPGGLSRLWPPPAGHRPYPGQQPGKRTGTAWRSRYRKSVLGSPSRAPGRCARCQCS